MELNRFLMDVYSKGKNAILVVDEAQNVNPYWLEQIRQLTNLETSTQKLLQVILSGQPKLEEHLANPGLKQLNQRISVRSRLSRLNKNETMQYIKHRLNVVNGDSEKIFETEALESVYEVSKGIPRLINVVCDNALMRGQKEKVSKIRAEIVLSLLKEGLITTADRQNESALTRLKSTMMAPKVPRITLKSKSNGSNGNGKLAKIMEFGNEFAGVDMGVLAIA